jgi:D-aminoacyl-tRNA deacylase
MRAVLSRVHEAHVVVEGNTVGRIGAGLLVYLGIGQGDTLAIGQRLLDKICDMRLFPGSLPEHAEKLHASLLESGGKLLLVSQFTLYADTRKGRRPSFFEAMAPSEASAMFATLVAYARTKVATETGVFGAHMDVHAVGNGPITITLDSLPSAHD